MPDYQYATGPRGGGGSASVIAPTAANAGNSFINPPPQGGNGPFGLVPGPVGLPDPFGDLSKVFPALGDANKAAGTDLLSQLGGNLSPATMNALKLASAQFGVGSGMGPGSGLATNDLFGNIAGFSEGLQQKGLQNYNSLIPTISGTQTVNPALQTEIASSNANKAAAPSPAAAASYAKQLFDEYLAKTHGPGGGTGSFAPGGGGPGGGTGGARVPASNDASFWGGGGQVVGGMVGGGGAVPAAADDWYARTFGGQKFGTPGPGNTTIGNPMYADEWDTPAFSDAYMNEALGGANGPDNGNYADTQPAFLPDFSSSNFSYLDI